MRIVFLDVDGVLNCAFTKETYQGFIGADHSLVENLSIFLNKSNEEEETKIVLSSSWRIGQDRNGADIPDSYNYLSGKLAEYGLTIYDDTPRIPWSRGQSRRGREIAGWFYMNRNLDIRGYVVLDDVLFEDFERYKILPHFVRTTFFSQSGGFRESYINKAMEIIRLPFTW